MRPDPVVELRVGTFNIRNGLGLDGRHLWPLRRRATARALADLDADVVGMQEVYRWQLRWLRRAVPGYAACGDGRSARGRGEHCAVLGREAAVHIVSSTTRWFGPTPDIPGTRLAGARFPRIATIAVVARVAGPGGPEPRRFQVVSTHLDERSGASREAAAAQLLGWLDPELPTLVLGDLNATPTSAPLRVFREGGLRSALPPDALGTNHRFTGATDGPRVDHILVSHHWEVASAEVVATPARRPFPSDHWPAVAVLRLR